MNAVLALVLFLDFDGASVTRGPESAATNSSELPTTYAEGTSKALAAFDATPYAPYYSAAAARAYITNKVAYWYAPFNVAVVSTRPTSGLYSEVLIGDTLANFATNAIDAVGMAPIDCGNASDTNVAFAFSLSVLGATPPTNANDAQVDLLLVAATAAHEAGHAFGLEHVNDPSDLMNAQVNAGMVGFVDATNMLTSPSQCAATNQNSAQRLRDNVGTASVVVPVVQLVSPKDGDVVGETFTAHVTATSTTSTIASVELDIGSLTVASTTTPPYDFTITAPSDGTLTLTAIAMSSDGSFGSATSTFTVQRDAPTQGVDAGTSTSTHSSGGCSLSSGTTSPLCALVLLFFLWLRRRARRSAT